MNEATASDMAERARRAEAASAGHRYTAGMAEAAEDLVRQELERERAHSAKLRATIRLIEEALVSDGSKRPAWGEGDELDHVVWDVRLLCRRLDEAKAPRGPGHKVAMSTEGAVVGLLARLDAEARGGK